MSIAEHTKNGACMLAGDIGGTKTRLGLFNPAKEYPAFDHAETFSSSDYPDLESVIDEFLKTREIAVAGACFGVAGPVINGKCRVTNLPWEISETNLQHAFSWPYVRLINDLAALSSSTRILKKEELLILQKGRPEEEGHRGVIAPGTGLGMSMLIKAENGYVLLPSEGGHADFAPNSEEEVELWRFIRNSFGHASVERIVSGPGLANIYRWLLERSGAPEPPWLADKSTQNDPARLISESAIKGDDPICEKALKVFVSVLGSAAGNLALMGPAFGGLYIGGGIAPKILPFLKNENFLRAFSDKGRFKDLLQDIPVYTILNDHAPLLGAAVYLRLELATRTYP